MDEKPIKQGGGAGVVLVVTLVLVALPILYVLSVGPLVWLDRHGYMSVGVRDALQMIYLPLAWTIENVPIVGPAIGAYAQLWGG